MHSVVLKRSYDSVKVFWLDSREALRRLRKAAGELLAARPEVMAVHLFGSLPEGRAVPGSDADVLILLRRCDQRWLDRSLEFSPYFSNVGMPVELFCYTIEEALQNRFVRRARERGVTLAERVETGA